MRAAGVAMAVGGMLLLLAAGGLTAGNAAGTPEDTFIVPIGGSPGGIPHVTWVAPHPGRLLYLVATGHSPGTGAGDINVGVVRASDGGVLCELTVPCDFGDGDVYPADGGVVECEDATFTTREVLHIEPLTTCATQPDLFLQVAAHVH